MSVKIGHAVVDENGNAVGGATGDQTGKEIRIQDWYTSAWNVYLECTDPTIANKAAEYMEEICNDPNYGYDQNQRLTLYNAILQNGGKVKGAKGETDCSALVSACYIFAGLNISPSNTTRSLRKALLGTGKFVEYDGFRQLQSASAAKRGGIYLREGAHVAMVLTNDNDAGLMPTSIVKLGMRGAYVKWIQARLNAYGYKLVVDGEFGQKTEWAVMDLQRNKRLNVDGIVGPRTIEALKN